MKKVLASLVIAAFITASFNIVVKASDGEINPGITPDSPLYLLDKVLESIQIGFIKDDNKKASILVDIAKERLDEAQIMVEENKNDLAVDAIEESQRIEEKVDKIVKVQKETMGSKDEEEQKKCEEILNKIDAHTGKSIEKLTILLNKVPEASKPIIEKIIKNQMLKKEALQKFIEAVHKVNFSKSKVMSLVDELSKANNENDIEKVEKLRKLLQEAEVQYKQAKENLVKTKEDVLVAKENVEKDKEFIKDEVIPQIKLQENAQYSQKQNIVSSEESIEQQFEKSDEEDEEKTVVIEKYKDKKDKKHKEHKEKKGHKNNNKH